MPAPAADMTVKSVYRSWEGDTFSSCIRRTRAPEFPPPQTTESENWLDGRTVQESGHSKDPYDLVTNELGIPARVPSRSHKISFFVSSHWTLNDEFTKVKDSYLAVNAP